MWIDELEGLLRRAAGIAADHQLDSDLFLRAAWAALLEAHPGLRAELADQQLREQIDRLRGRGKLPMA